MFRRGTHHSKNVTIITRPCDEAKFKADCKAINNIESKAHGAFADLESFLFHTIKAHVYLGNALINGFNLYRHGKMCEVDVPGQDLTLAQHRLIKAQVYLEKAVEDI